jgi:uncharacterized RDD family membrane protein YckC
MVQVPATARTDILAGMTQMSAGIGSDDLVTGEAVALQLPAATLGVRVASGVIDLTVEVLALLGAMLLAAVLTAGSDEALVGTASVVATVGALIVLPTALETLTRGKSVGKWIFGLRTVRDDAGPIGFRHALIRALVALVEIWAMSGVPALISGLVSSRGKRLGDYAAGTYVVRDRFRLTMPAPVGMPPHLAHWAATADIAALPDGLALAVRQFLARAGTLTPPARARVGDELARQVMGLAAPPPPPGTHPEYLLAAVLSERRARDAARLARESALRQRLLGQGRHPQA